MLTTQNGRQRPTNRNPQNAARVIEALNAGATYEAAAESIGMKREALGQWRVADPDFDARCVAAREAGLSVDDDRFRSRIAELSQGVKRRKTVTKRDAQGQVLEVTITEEDLVFPGIALRRAEKLDPERWGPAARPGTEEAPEGDPALVEALRQALTGEKDGGEGA